MAADLALCAEALFSTHVQQSDQWPPSSIRAAVAFRVAMMTASEIAAMVAQEFGDHPETAVARMQWCRRAVADALPESAV